MNRHPHVPSILFGSAGAGSSQLAAFDMGASSIGALPRRSRRSESARYAAMFQSGAASSVMSGGVSGPIEGMQFWFRYPDNLTTSGGNLVTWDSMVGSYQFVPRTGEVPSDSGSGVRVGDNRGIVAAHDALFEIGTGDFSVFVALHADIQAAGQEGILFTTAQSHTTSGIKMWGGVGANVVLRWLNNNGITRVTSSNSITNGTNGYFAVVRSSGTVTLYVNGTSSGTNADTRDLTHATAGTSMGEYPTALNNSNDYGHILEVMFFDSAITGSDFTAIDSYLKSQHSI